MGVDLKTALLAALAGSSSQRPVDVAMLYKIGAVSGVRAALLELYREHRVYCCLYQRGGREAHSVWWLVGGVGAPHGYGKTGRICGSCRSAAA